ncbi:transglycosylase domain-containing protein [Streptomyces sp. NPDC020983]|uniref:transglycosylase domain-containing protein n=1 Tax=Streptomyces sp. NPDC020983 TaxID=3365106 RepID=UPI0037928AF2
MRKASEALRWLRGPRARRNGVGERPRFPAAARRVLRVLRPRYPRPGRRGVRRWLPSPRQTLLAFCWVLALLAGLVGYGYARTEIPTDLNAFATQQDNVYYWADGTEMARVGPVDRQSMPLSRIPASLQAAVLSAENASFYTDSGISLRGLTRAVKAMATGGEAQGGSTITQQYVKNVYLSQSRTFSRKITEMFLAVKLDRKLSKDQILDGYLNTSWFGRGAYGVQRAAKAYYGKDVSQLTVSESALLAALLKGAGMFDPALGPANHKRAVRRWSWVLDRMVQTGHLSAAARRAITVFPEPQAPPRPAGLGGQTGYLVDTARAYVSAHSDISDAQFDRGGYQIYTTFEKPRVTALAAAVRTRLAALDPAARPADRDVRAGAASVAPDGRILALYGGPDYVKQGFDDANITIVPVGTVYAPLVYAAGLRDGVQLTRGAPRTPVTPDTLYDGDDKVTVRTPEGPYWSRDGKIVRVANDGGRSWGRIPLRKAVAEGVNTPVVQLGMDVGIDRVRRASVDAGLLPDSGFGEQVPQFSLGTATPSPIRVASAYATFAAHGTHTAPYSVLRVTRDGDPAPLRAPAVTHPFTPGVAAAVATALDRGSGRKGLAGTSPGNTSAWYAGWTPTAATTVALFRINPTSQQTEPLTGTTGTRPHEHTGSIFPAAIWSAYTAATG